MGIYTTIGILHQALPTEALLHLAMTAMTTTQGVVEHIVQLPIPIHKTE